MDDSTGNQDTHIPTYIQELMTMIQASQERMQTLEKNNMQMMETISKFASSTTSQIQPANSNRGKNTSDIAILPMTNTGNGENTSNLFFGNTSVVNPFIVGTSTTVADTSTTIAGTSTVIVSPIIAQDFVTKEELQKLLVQKNKSLSFSKFDLKLPYPTSVATEPYPKDYTSPKFKQFNGKTSDAREHVMKFVETLSIARLDDDLKWKEFSKSLTEKAYTGMSTLLLAL
ncbi:hypothetical protein CRYUN_Cryun01aG0118900 [Craigia yunnanensis]